MDSIDCMLDINDGMGDLLLKQLKRRSVLGCGGVYMKTSR